MQTGSIIRIILSILLMLGVLGYLFHSASVSTRTTPALHSTLPDPPPQKP